MINVAINIDPADLNRTQLMFSQLSDDRLAAKTLRQVLSDLIRKYRTQVRRELSKRTGLQQKLFAPRIKVTVPIQTNLRGGKITASLWVGTNPIPVSRTFRPGQYLKQRGSGVVIGTKTQDKISLQRGTFLAKSRGGKITVFQRSAGATSATGRDRAGRVRRGRLPIKELVLRYGESAEDILRAIAGSDDFLQQVEERFFRKLNQYLETVNGYSPE